MRVCILITTCFVISLISHYTMPDWLLFFATSLCAAPLTTLGRQLCSRLNAQSDIDFLMSLTERRQLIAISTTLNEMIKELKIELQLIFCMWKEYKRVKGFVRIFNNNE